MGKMFDRENNPSALLRVSDCENGKCAVFIKYANSNHWEKYTKDYTYRKCAMNKARIIEITNYAHKIVEE